MFSIRFTTFLLVCLLFSLHVWNSHAERVFPNAGIDELTTRIAGFAGSASTAEKEQQAGINSAKGAREHVESRGGKMKIRKTLGEDSTSKKSESYTGEAPKVSGAKDAASNEMNLRSKGQGQVVRVKTRRFVPFSADYYVPRPHPPKNN